jgi:hypothetical protein
MDAAINGPDGADLKLLTEYEPSLIDEETEEATNLWSYASYSVYPDAHYRNFTCHWDPDLHHCVCDSLEFTEILQESFDRIYKIVEVVVPVGPILFLFQFLGRTTKDPRYWQYYYEGCHHYIEPAEGDFQGYCYNTTGLVVTLTDHPEGRTQPNGNNDGTTLLGYWTGDGVDNHAWIGIKVKAALYTDELYERMKSVGRQISPIAANNLKNLGQIEQPISEFTLQTELSTSWNSGLWYLYYGLAQPDLNTFLMSCGLY